MVNTRDINRRVGLVEIVIKRYNKAVSSDRSEWVSTVHPTRR